MADSNFLGSSEKFDSPNIDLFQVDDTHAKYLLADVVGFLVYSGDINDFIWGEVGQDRRRWPDSQVTEDSLPSLRCHTFNKIRL